MNIPGFNPNTECLSIVTDQQGTHFKVVKEMSKDKRIESNMKVAQYVSDNFKEINPKSIGFKRLIDSVERKFTQGEFSKNPEFVISAMKGRQIETVHLVNNLKKNPDVMLAAIKETGGFIGADESLYESDDFIIKSLKASIGSIVHVVGARFHSDPKVDAEKLMTGFLKDFDADTIKMASDFLKHMSEEMLNVRNGKKIRQSNEVLPKEDQIKFENMSLLADELKVLLDKREKKL